ncbi:type II toxin-antitoxin system death-on-curing family toxin [Halobacteriaceae archaeon GCM10025711]
MSASSEPPLWYPTVTDIINIHKDIIEEYPGTEPGIRKREDIAYAVEYVEHGAFGEVPQSIHQKAFHLLRLLTANHPFVDGNKRTALATVATFYFLNGYEFEYDHEIRTVLKTIATDATTVDEAGVLEYLKTHSRESDLENAVEMWRANLVEEGLDRLRELQNNEGTDEDS